MYDEVPLSFCERTAWFVMHSPFTNSNRMLPHMLKYTTRQPWNTTPWSNVHKKDTCCLLQSVSSLVCLRNCLPSYSRCMDYKLHGQIMSWASSIYECRSCMASTSTTIHNLHHCGQAINEGPYSLEIRSCHAHFNFSHLCFRSPMLHAGSSLHLLSTCVVCWVGEHQDRLAYQCSPCENLYTHET